MKTIPTITQMLSKRAKHTTSFKDSPTLTQQQFKESCDINNILAKYQKTGVLDHINLHQEQYSDITSIDFTESMNLIANATSMFEELPSKARKNFDNDPRKFLDYVQDPKNNDSLVDMGLAHPPTPTTPPSVSDDQREEMVAETPPAG